MSPGVQRVPHSSSFVIELIEMDAAAHKHIGAMDRQGSRIICTILSPADGWIVLRVQSVPQWWNFAVIEVRDITLYITFISYMAYLDQLLAGWKTFLFSH